MAEVSTMRMRKVIQSGTKDVAVRCHNVYKKIFNVKGFFFSVEYMSDRFLECSGGIKGSTFLCHLIMKCLEVRSNSKPYCFHCKFQIMPGFRF